MSRKKADADDAVGGRVRRVRKNYSLSMAEFAERVHCSRSHLASVEYGKAKPSRMMLALIAKEFGADEDWLLTGKRTTVEAQATRFKAVRKRLQMSIEEFAEHLGVKKELIERIELQKTPLEEFQAKLYQERIGLSAGWLLNGEGLMFENDSPEEEKSYRIDPVEIQVISKINKSGITIPSWTPPDLSSFEMIPMAQTELSAGGGALVLSEDDGELYAFRKDWLKRKASSSRNVALMQVRGDSMEPIIIDGDVVMIDKGRRKVHDGYIYALGVGEMISVKRLYYLPDGCCKIKSDNPEFESYNVDLKDIRILGQVIWRAGRPSLSPPHR